MKILIFAFVLLVGQFSHAEIDGFVGYSFADKYKADAGDAEADKGLFFGARYKSEINEQFKWNAGLGYETRGVNNYGSNAGIDFILLEGNIVYTIDKPYLFAGLNFPGAITQIEGNKARPAVGAQIGAGYSFTDVCGLELYYRMVNFEFTGEDAELSGIALRTYYTFSAL